MHAKGKFCLLLMFSLVAIGLVGCSSDNPANPPSNNNPVDTTAPQVTGVDPGDGQTGVDIDEDILITFSEPMDPTSATGNITLSAGTVSGTSWTDSRNLVVSHSSWTEGAHITVTVGTGLADEAGNTLATAHSFSFYVFSSNLTVLETNPAHGSTEINRDSAIQILFSHEVATNSLTGNVTITDGMTNFIPSFQTENSSVTMTVGESYPADTEITVTLGTGIAGHSGGNLASPYVFSFTTSQDVDVTPPTVVSVFPAMGSTVDPDVGYFQITFSEPMNQMTLEPSGWNVEFALLIMESDPTPSWTENGTVMTVPLPLNLPAGLPIEITFSGFTDLNGVEQVTPWTFEATVAGTAEYFPVTDGLQLAFEFFEEGGPANSPAEWFDSGTQFIQLDVQPDDTFFYADYDPTFTTPSGDHEIYQKLSNQLQWLGFQEYDEMDGPMVMMFDSPLNFLPLPLSAGTWTSSASVVVPDEGTYNATINGTVVGQFDLPVDSEGSESLFYKNAWKVIRNMDVTLDGSPAMAIADTSWYSPTLGPVQSSEYEDQIDESRWGYESMWRIFDVR